MRGSTPKLNVGCRRLRRIRTRGRVEQVIQQTELLIIDRRLPRKPLLLHRRLNHRIEILADCAHGCGGLVPKYLEQRPDVAEDLAFGNAQHRLREGVGEPLRGQRLRRAGLCGREGDVVRVREVGFEGVDAGVEEKLAGGVHGKAADEVLSTCGIRA